MNNYYKTLFLLTILIVQSCKNASESLENPKIATIEILEKEFDFGQVSMEDSASFTFSIKNISKIPFKISKVGTSCGCTTTE
jgi:hypothetical protein